ncbi:MAG: response regulator transcription factor [Actinomycetota bacterium]
MSRTHPNILVVDDDPSVRMLVADVLETEGYDVHAVADGFAALARVNCLAPDCIILDVMMPGMDGHAVLDQIRARASEIHVPVVMLTANAADDQAWQAWSEGVDYFMTKPFDPEELLRYLSYLVAAPTAADA